MDTALPVISWIVKLPSRLQIQFARVILLFCGGGGACCVFFCLKYIMLADPNRLLPKEDFHLHLQQQMAP